MAIESEMAKMPMATMIEKKAPLDEVITDLHISLDHLNQQISILRGRLIPVSVSQKEDTSNNINVPEDLKGYGSSNAVSHLAESVYAVDNLIKKINTIMYELEI